MEAAPLLLAAGSALDADPTTLVAAAAAAGFDGVGVRLSAAQCVDRVGLAALAARAVDLGLFVHDVEVYRIGDPEQPDAGPLIDAAAQLGARFLLVVSDLDDEGATEHRLAAVVAEAAAAGVDVGVEYMAWTCPGGPRAAMRLAAATGAHIVVDVLHHVRVGGDAAMLAEVVASGRVGWVQLCDAPAAAPPDLVAEARHFRLPPGAGELPLDDLLAALPSATPISVEVQSDRLVATHRPTERAQHLYAAASSVLSRRG